MIPPWGTPITDDWNFFFPPVNSTYPALTNFQYRLSRFFSRKYSDIPCDSRLWSIQSKNLVMSPSMNQATPFQSLTSFKAE